MRDAVLLKEIDLQKWFGDLNKSIQNNVAWIRKHESTLQIINPFRILLKLTLTPLRIVLFMGHLVSIGVTSDRFPGIPEIISAIIGIISEGFEDAHYFVDNHDAHEAAHDTQSLLKERLSGKHGHDHANDIPTQIVKALFYPIYCLSALWDCLASKQNANKEDRLSYSRALQKQMGLQEESYKLPKEALSPSHDWQNQHVIYLIERQKEKLPSSGIGEEKRDALMNMQTTLVNDPWDFSDDNKIKARIDKEINNPIYNTHRITPDFLSTNQETNTHVFLKQLHKRTKSPTSVVDIWQEEDMLTKEDTQKEQPLDSKCTDASCKTCPPRRKKTNILTQKSYHLKKNPSKDDDIDDFSTDLFCLPIGQPTFFSKHRCSDPSAHLSIQTNHTQPT
jgi:hypothetical protein